MENTTSFLEVLGQPTHELQDAKLCRRPLLFHHNHQCLPESVSIGTNATTRTHGPEHGWYAASRGDCVPFAVPYLSVSTLGLQKIGTKANQLRIISRKALKKYLGWNFVRHDWFCLSGRLFENRNIE
jgi:hypothetical protein